MIKWIAAIASGTIVIITIWFASPYSALRGIQQGIADNNADAVSEHIDYDVLRSNLKVRIEDYTVETMAAGMPLLFKERALSQARGFIAKGVDAYVTPEMLKRLTQGKPIKNPDGTETEGLKQTWDVRWWTERKSLNEMWLYVVPTNPQYEGREIVVHLHRIYGITWKVVDIDPTTWKQWIIQRLRLAPPLG